MQHDIPPFIRAAIHANAHRWTTTTVEPLTDVLRLCLGKQPADVYAIGPHAGDYCHAHVPTGLTSTDTITR